MTLTIVIGNGETRAGFDLDKLMGHTTFGCNAIAREWNPTHLLACDRMVVEEIVDMGKRVYTRSHWHRNFDKYPYVNYFPELPYHGDKKEDQPMNWGSGTYAVYMACLTDTPRIFIIGYDIYSPSGKHNNIYKGTEHYGHDDANPVNPKFWIYQLNKLHELYSTIEFTYVYPDEWPRSEEWMASNISYINYDIFQKYLLTNP